MRSLRTIFVMSPQPEGRWILNALEDGRTPQSLGEFQGGTKGDAASRRLAAARIVTAIGNWTQKGQPLSAKKPVQSEPTGRWQDTPIAAQMEEQREPTYGTMGKFLGLYWLPRWGNVSLRRISPHCALHRSPISFPGSLRNEPSLNI